MIGETIRAATLDRRQRAGRIALADGRTLEYAGVPLPDGNGLLTVLDITDSQKAEEALRQRNAALEEADAMKTRFLANMSYEFRTPLNGLSGMSELLASTRLDSEQRGYVETIQAASRSLMSPLTRISTVSLGSSSSWPRKVWKSWSWSSDCVRGPAPVVMSRKPSRSRLAANSRNAADSPMASL